MRNAVMRRRLRLFLEALVLLITELAFPIADIFKPKYTKQPLMTMQGKTMICRMSVTDLTCSDVKDDIR